MNAYIITAGILFAVSFAFMLYYSKWFWLKITTITLLFAIVNMIYFSFDSIKGWPSHDKIHKGQLVYVEIVEPTETYKGAIYLYVRIENEEKSWLDNYINYYYWDANAPRSYYIPYTEKSSQSMREAKEAMEKGYIVEVEGDSAEQQNQGNGEPSEDNGNGTEQPDGGEADDYKVPHLKLVDPRERSGKVQQ
jgi:hypothetical protein